VVAGDPATVAACYGVLCPRRGACALHEALGLADGPVIESCQRGPVWPLFMPAERDGHAGRPAGRMCGEI
jgi:hypothetical protein